MLLIGSKFFPFTVDLFLKGGKDFDSLKVVSLKECPFFVMPNTHVIFIRNEGKKYMSSCCFCQMTLFFTAVDNYIVNGTLCNMSNVLNKKY